MARGRKKQEMVGDKPKFRMVKAKKRRGIKALGRRRAIGGMERQILNPATGKYVTYLGPKQEMRLYSPDALAKIEKKEGARKIKAAEIKKKAATPKAAPKKTPKVEKKKTEPTPPKIKTRADTTPKPKPKAPDLKLPDILQEDIRIKPGALEGLTAKPVVKAKEKPKPKKEVKTPKKGKVREREDIRVDTPTREEIDKVIKDLDIKIPEVINIPGVGQVTIPAAPKPPVETPKDPITSGPKISPGGPGGAARGELFGSPEDYDKFTGRPGSGAISSGTTVYDRYDPETDTYFGSVGGIAGNVPISVKGSQVSETFKKNFALAQTPEISIPTPVPGPAGPKPDVGREPAPDLPPAPPVPVRVDTTPQPTPPPEPTPPPPPQFIDMDPLRGMRDTIIPRNILGQSFDPSVRDDYEKQMQAARAAMMQPGGNIRATEYPTYQTPTLAVPQTQFGGYGQPMPVAPLLPYAGLATATPPQEIPRPPASGARVNPGTGQIEPIGVAPDPGLVNLPPGVTGPIR